MDELLAKTMVETLAKGIDPTTGYSLPANHLCNNEEMQEALETVLQHCTIESYREMREREREEKEEAKTEKRRNNRDRYSNHRTVWTKDDVARLVELNKHKNIWYSAAVLGRSPSVIESKLRHLEILPNRTRTRRKR